MSEWFKVSALKAEGFLNPEGSNPSLSVETSFCLMIRTHSEFDLSEHKVPDVLRKAGDKECLTTKKTYKLNRV